MNILRVKHDDDVASFTMTDPARRNALSSAMLVSLTEAFDTLPKETRVVILRADNDQPVWCSGFDIRALSPGFDPLAPEGPLQTLFARIANCRAPVIAMVRGSTWGGGTDLALRCDMVIADTTCQFAFTPAKLGLPYDVEGLVNVFNRVGAAVAIEMFATAEPIAAERALAVGLVNHLVAPALLETFVGEIAKRISMNAPLSVSSAKQHLRALTAALPLSAPILRMLEDGRTRALESKDYAEGLSAFAAKRPPAFTGS